MTTPTRTGELCWSAELADFANRVLGPGMLIADLSWPYGADWGVGACPPSFAGAQAITLRGAP